MKPANIAKHDITGKRGKFTCKKCRHEFTDIALRVDYGYGKLGCNKCYKTKFVVQPDDKIYSSLCDKSGEIYPGASDEAVKKQIKWWHKEFLKTCDPCECGGKFKFYSGWILCPECGSDEAEALKFTVIYPWKQLIKKVKIEFATHDKWHKLHPKKAAPTK